MIDEKVREGNAQKFSEFELSNIHRYVSEWTNIISINFIFQLYTSR